MEGKKYTDAPNMLTRWSRYSTYFLVALTVIVIPALLTLRAEAEVAVFHFDTYVEQGAEITGESETENYTQYDYLWADFKGNAPKDAVINNIRLLFTWTSVTRSVVEATTTVSEDVPLATTTTEEQVGGGVVEENIEEPLPEPVEETDEVRDPVEEVPEIIETSEPEEVPEEEPVAEPVPEVENDPEDTTGFEEVSRDEVYPYANAEFEEAVATDTIPVLLLDNAEVLIAESISTTSGFVSPEVIVENLEEKFFEVRYTIDGSVWETLGRIGFNESHDIAFDLSQIPLDAIPNLQIAIRYTVPAGDQTKIIFDNMRLEVEHGNLLEEVLESDAPTDREPNFAISSVKKDIQSENIRVVLLERGGMFEFWYSITARNSNEVEWNRLVLGGSVDSDAPMAIKERTIFWLDKNQQTLFGFSVDDESLIGVPFVDPENKVFLLPFQNDDEEKWEATFDPDLNSLEFRKVRKTSS